MNISTNIAIKIYLTFGCLFIAFLGSAQTVTSPQVPFLQRSSTATPTKKIYNVKGDFTLLGNTNLSLLSYGETTDNQSNTMKYIDIDGDSNTLNSSMATLELSNSGENSANQNCSTVLFAGLYWTGKSDDSNETFGVTYPTPMEAAKNVTHNSSTNITNTNYKLTISRGGSSGDYYPIYNFTNSLGNTYAFHFTNVSGGNRVKLSVNGGALNNYSVSYNSGVATFGTPYSTAADGITMLKINSLTRNPSASLTEVQYQDPANSIANVQVFEIKNYNKKVVSLKGPSASTYTTITGNTEIRYPGASNSGIFIGYQEITDYVKTHGAGAYTVADIALKEGSNSNPGLSGGWGMIVIYENPVMKSRAITLFDGYAYVNGQLAGGGEYGNIDISGFTTVATGQVNMKLGVMAAEGDVGLTGDYLAVQKLNANPSDYPANYLVLNHAGNATTNFFNSSIFPVPTGGITKSNPNLVNNTGVDFSMFTIPNTGNTVIGNNQTSTTFRFGSTSDVFTIFGCAMSVDAYVPDPKGLSSVNSINGSAVSYPLTINASPGQAINYSISITNEGTEATNSTLITIPIPSTAIFQTGTITTNLYYGATQVSAPTYNSGANTITWNLGTLPITDGHPEYIYAVISFTLNVTNDCSIILNAGCNPVVTLATGTMTGTGAISGSSFTKYFFQGYDGTSCNASISGSIQVAINGSSCTAAMAGLNRVSACGGENVTLAATAGTAGEWSIVDGPAGGGEVFSDSTSPSSVFNSLNSGTYTLRWTSTSCGANYDDVLATISLCNVVNFDGTDDNINFKNKFNLNSGSFSIEAWIKSNASNGNTQIILSKHLSPSDTDGYDLRLVSNAVKFYWNNNSIVATHAIDTNRWYHIAVTFDGTNYKLYLDGILDKTAAGVNPTSNSVDFMLGAMSQGTDIPYNYYDGYMDELRFWNVSLTVEQIRQTMNQEIANDGSGNVKGVVVPKNISGLSWVDLTGYYQMNQANDILNGYLVDKSGNSKTGKLKGIYVQEPDTAPIPYTSRANGSWETDATWTNYDVWDVPNSFGIDGTTKIDWNIVKTSHNIPSNSNKTVLGLLVNSNTLSAANDSKIEVSSYLKLDGKIDLVGKSQLLQTTNSDLDPTSSGAIERDQQGQANKYNYNYWCSPVSPINTTANNTNYTVAEMLKDGTTSTPQNINWISGYDGAPTTPISLARYWLYTFDNYVNAYANWNRILQTTPIRVGQGFTLKGSGAAAGNQNYTFTGKPNNGLISTNSVASNQLLLTGNPYPSALDAVAFINENASSIDGTLYFWEHYTTNYTHVLRDYQGGYATLNLVGGVAAGSIPSAVDVDFISGSGTPSKGAPKQYIPVGQGFFVTGKTGFGGTVIFNNNQRAFYKEDETSYSNLVFKTKANSKTNTISNRDNNVPIAKDTLKRIRLGFNATNNYHRQLLLGFMNEKATSKMDYGYDSYILDDFPNDMYFLSGENQLVIQGEGFFDVNANYPIGVKTAVEGIISFTIDALENFNPEQLIFIYDNFTDTYHNIRSTRYEVNLPIGTYDTRFSLRFKDKTLRVNQHAISEAIQILYIQNGNSLEIKNKSIDLTVEKVTLYNILGQSISTCEIENQDQQNIQIPIKSISSGVYIAKLKTSEGEISKKVVVFDK